MSKYDITATMKAGKFGIISWRKIVKCITTFTGLSRDAFAESTHAWKKLGEGAGKIKGRKWEYYQKGGETKRPEIVQWWIMEPSWELEQR